MKKLLLHKDIELHENIIIPSIHFAHNLSQKLVKKNKGKHELIAM